MSYPRCFHCGFELGHINDPCPNCLPNFDRRPNAFAAAPAPTVSDEVVFPERLTLRDTKVFADEGQRIFTTATGYGYEKQEYVRADLTAPTRAEVLEEAAQAVLAQIDSHPDWSEEHLAQLREQDPVLTARAAARVAIKQCVSAIRALAGKAKP